LQPTRDSALRIARLRWSAVCLRQAPPTGTPRRSARAWHPSRRAAAWPTAVYLAAAHRGPPCTPGGRDRTTADANASTTAATEVAPPPGPQPPPRAAPAKAARRFASARARQPESTAVSLRAARASHRSCAAASVPAAFVFRARHGSRAASAADRVAARMRTAARARRIAGRDSRPLRAAVNPGVVAWTSGRGDRDLRLAGGEAPQDDSIAGEGGRRDAVLPLHGDPELIAPTASPRSAAAAGTFDPEGADPIRNRVACRPVDGADAREPYLWVTVVAGETHCPRPSA
jgi:hypothetical protein